MSFAVDVNLLIYASATQSPQHPKASGFMATCVAGPEVCCFAWVTLMGYLRIVTQPRILAAPLSHSEAIGNVESLLALPHVRVIGELDTFWQTYRQLTARTPIRGDLVPDAHLAAILQCNGIKTLYTHDRDFRRFPFLDVRDPLG